MRNAISIFILFLCCLLAATFLVVSVWMLPHELLHDSEGWGMMLVGFIDVPLLAGTGLLGALPSAMAFWLGGRRKIDRISLCISVATFALIAMTLLVAEPVRAAIIFRRYDSLWLVGFFLATAGAAILFALAIPARLGLHRGTEGGRGIGLVRLCFGAAGAVCAWRRSLPFAHILTVYWS